MTELKPEVHIGTMSRCGHIPEAFLVSEAYKPMFDHIWKQVFVKLDKGVIITRCQELVSDSILAGSHM